MSGPNIAVSNGTCYTAAGQKLDEGFIPCGNDVFGHQTCCGAGDKCLADLACFGIYGSGYGSFLTYFAGCTDPDYKDASCPNKEVDQPWVALTLCDNSGGAWAICSQKDNPTTLQPGSYCSCTNSASATVAFKDSTSLADIASLPQRTGQTISFFAGHSPSASSPSTVGSSTSGVVPSTSSTPGSSGTTKLTSSPASTSTLPGGSVTTVFSTVQSGSSGSQSGSSAGQGSSSSKLGTGTIVGIAIGAIVAVLLLIVLTFLLLRRRRRRSRFENGSSGAKLSKQRESDRSTAPTKLGRPTTPSMPEAEGVPVSEVMGRPVTPWKLRSELDGKQVVPGKKAKSRKVIGGATRKESDAIPPIAELPGSVPEPKRNAAAGPIEEAMVAPLMLRPKNERVGQVLPNDGGSSARPDINSPLEIRQAASQDGGLAAGPEGGLFPGEQQTAQETGHRPWGWPWRGVLDRQKSNRQDG